jgi:hypothetical protein
MISWLRHRFVPDKTKMRIVVDGPNYKRAFHLERHDALHIIPWLDEPSVAMFVHARCFKPNEIHLRFSEKISLEEMKARGNT